MKIFKLNKNKNLLEQIEIQKKIIEELTHQIILLKKEIDIINMNNGVYMCKKCGKLFLFQKINEEIKCC
jgi:predicted Zn-ribbon and HTH transcriptional regulator